MATQTVEFPCATSQTVTAKLFSFGSDTEVASVSATEATNRKGLYTAAFTDVAAGTYRLIALNGSSVPLAAWDVTLTLTTATFQAYEIGMTVPLIAANVTHFGGTAGTFSSGRPEVNATHWAGTAVGSVTINCNMTQISGDTTAADNAEAFFDGTGYAGTNNVIPTVTTLTNKTGFSLLANTGLGNQTADITGSLSGSVGSVTGAVGSVTGNVGGNVTGSVGSVVGNVGGSVASVASGGITSSSFAADSITASALAASAVTEIQSGLSTLTTLQVNAEVLDVLQTDTFAELSAPPAATSSLKDKITWVFQWLRNKSTQTSTQRKLYADDGSTVVSTETVSDDGTTYTKGEQA